MAGLPSVREARAQCATKFENHHARAACPKFDCRPVAVRAPPPRACACASGGALAEPDRAVWQLKPLRWLHVPKTGTSFANSVVQVACGVLPEWAEIRVRPDYLARTGNPGGLLPLWFQACFPEVVPAQCSFTAKSWSYMVDHVPIGADEVKALGALSFVTILRAPVPRLLSLYNQWLREIKLSFGDGQHNASERHLLGWLRPAKGQPLHTGCTTKMLVGRKCDEAYPSADEVALAKERLSRFAFVGLEDQWELSMCLFHRLYGRHVPALALSNVRPGKATLARVAAQTAMLRAAGFVDQADEEIYAHGRRLFAAQLRARMGANATCAASLTL